MRDDNEYIYSVVCVTGKVQKWVIYILTWNHWLNVGTSGHIFHER